MKLYNVKTLIQGTWQSLVIRAEHDGEAITNARGLFLAMFKEDLDPDNTKVEFIRKIDFKEPI